MRHKLEYVIITWFRLRTTKWTHKNFPNKLPELNELVEPQLMCVCSGVNLMKHRSLAIG